MFLPQRRKQSLLPFDLVGKLFECRRDLLHFVAVEDHPAAADTGERGLELCQHRQLLFGEDVVTERHGPVDVEHV